jgi:hypothetical protein
MSDLESRIHRLVESGIRPLEFEEIPRRSARGWQRPRPSRPLVLAGAGSLVLVGLVLVATVVFLSGPARYAPRQGANAHHNTTHAAQEVLYEASKTATSESSQALVPGQSLNITESFLVHGFVKGANGEKFYYNVTGSGAWSLNADGSGTESITLGNPTFPSAADQATWVDLGSPALVPSHQITETLPLSQAEAEAQAAQGGLGAPPSAPTVLPYTDVAALPTNPDSLEQDLVKQYENGQLDVGQTFDLAANLLEEGAGPQQRSALFQMVASLPGVSLDAAAVTDIIGQKGTGVSINVEGVRHELIFDPTTSAVLEERNVVSSAWPTSIPKPSSKNPSVSPLVGTQILAYTVFQNTTVAPVSSKGPA